MIGPDLAFHFPVLPSPRCLPPFVPQPLAIAAASSSVAICLLNLVTDFGAFFMIVEPSLFAKLPVHAFHRFAESRSQY